MVEELSGKDRDEIAAWFDANQGFIAADNEGKLLVDAEAREFGIAPNTGEFIHAAIDAIAPQSANAPLARKLLARYLPDGPGIDATQDEWNAKQSHRQHRQPPVG